jgi:uncharacterized protein YecT (DUF1311 family)
MKIITSVAAAAVLSQICWAQAGWSGSVGSNSGLEITVESKLEPPKPDTLPDGQPAISGVKWLGKNKTEGAVGMIRYSENTKTHEYFGYEVVAEPIEQAGTYQVTFSTLTSTAEDLGLPTPGNWHMLPPPIFPPSQVVGTADIIAVDVFENPATGQKIVDYIRLKRDNCDTRTGSAQITCLSGLVQDAQRSLEAKLKEKESAADTATAAAIKDSQKAWQKYRDEACASVTDQLKHLQCELKLIRNRTRELAEIY